MHAFDRQTDGQIEFSSLDRVSNPCSAVKTNSRTDSYTDRRTITTRTINPSSICLRRLIAGDGIKTEKNRPTLSYK